MNSGNPGLLPRNLHEELLPDVETAVVEKRHAPAGERKNVLPPEVGAFAESGGLRRDVFDLFNGLRATISSRAPAILHRRRRIRRDWAAALPGRPRWRRGGARSAKR